MSNDPTMTLPLAAALCREAAGLSNRAGDRLDHLADTHPEPDALCEGLAGVFGELETAGARRQQAQRDIVAAMREAGCTWERVGTLLGITRQAAWERFGKGSHGVG